VIPTDLPADTQVRKLTCVGTLFLDKVQYKVAGERRHEHVLVITSGENITIADLDGEILIEHTRATPGVTYVGNGRLLNPDPGTLKTSPMS